MKNKLSTILIILLLSLTVNSVLADIGPKPSLNIHIMLNGRTVPDKEFYAKILDCQNEDKFSDEGVIPQLRIVEYDPENNCYWTPQKWAWGGDCSNGTCHFTYFIPSKFRIAVYLPSQNKTYLSPEVRRKNFRSTFEADLLPNGTIVVRETTPFFQTIISRNIRNFLIALVITLILEPIIAIGYIRLKKNRKKLVTTILLANVISLPVVWFVFPLLKLNELVIIALGEIFAIVFEGCFIHLLNKSALTLKESLKISVSMNLISFIVGTLIFAFLL